MAVADDASAIYHDYLERQLQGEGTDIDALCARHPEIADDLRRLEHEYREMLDLLQQMKEPSPEARAAQAAGSQGTSARAQRYDVQEEIAKGGMGSILLAWDKDLRRKVAMKVALDGSTNATLARFVEEAQVTGQLDHPGIVPVHELGIDADGREFFTMRFVKGRNLKQIFELAWAERDGWSVTRALNDMLKVCEAMAFAHDKGVIHRDLKPANVMVGRYGEVYVMDWGLARVMGNEDLHDIRLRQDAFATLSLVQTNRQDERMDTPDSPLVTMDGAVVGTPSYMPPEQAMGMVEKIGPRADVYAAGAMLYHLLTRQPPYVRPEARVSQHTVLRWVIDGPPKPMHELNPEIPAELVAICEKAMAREIEDRYTDMRQMADDLRAYLEHRVVAAYETGSVAELKKWVRRNMGMAASMLAAVLILAAGLAATMVFYRDADRARASEKNQKDELLRLADAQLLRELDEREKQLWPEMPEKVAAMDAWLQDAEKLSQNLDRHRADLERLRASALPYDAEMQRKDRETHPKAEELARLRQELDSLRSSTHEWPTNEWSSAVERTATTIAEVTSEVETRRTWCFADQKTRWWHYTLAGITTGIERLATLMTEVAERRNRAVQVEEATISDWRDSWNEAAESIANPADCPRYQGLTISPQIGLVPLGRNAVSGLWQFAHPRSGEIPQLDADGSVLLTDSTCIVFVLLPGGTFLMGAQGRYPGQSNYDQLAQGDQAPTHSETLAPFFLAMCETTQSQWLSLAGYNPSHYNPITFPSHHTLRDPVESVSYLACESICERYALSLPTEAQWEYAARSGTSMKWWTGNDVKTIEGAANVADRALSQSPLVQGVQFESWLDDRYPNLAPVGWFRPSPFGLYDVIGNVWEWCRDWYGSYAVPASSPDGYREVPPQGYRVNRGGSFYNTAALGTAAYRNHDQPEHQENTLGFRAARRLLGAQRPRRSRWQKKLEHRRPLWRRLNRSSVDRGGEHLTRRRVP